MQGSSREALKGARQRLDQLVDEQGGEDAGLVARTVARVRGHGPAELMEVGEQLFAVSDLLDRELGLRRALADPSVAPEARARLVDRLLSDQLAEPTLEVLKAAVEARWSASTDLVVGLDELGSHALLASEQVAGSLEQVEDELFRFARLVDRTPELSLALSDPGLPADRKRALLERLLGDRVRPVSLRLVTRVVEAPHGRAVGRALEALAQVAAERRQRSIAVVTVARPLDEEQVDRLRSAVSRAFGREVELQVIVDPSVLGGVSVRVGDELVDGTVARRLDEVHRRLNR